MPPHRESAHTLMQRLNATPISLLPSLFQKATSGGLRHNDICIVGGAPNSGKTQWAARVAAKQLYSGGAVTFIFLPGSGNFMMRRLMEHLESIASSTIQVERRTEEEIITGKGKKVYSSTIEDQREALLESLDRLEVVHCVDITDLAVYCIHGPINTINKCNTSETVPLIIIEGCGGKGSYLHHMERAIGHEAPLCYWIIDCLQRRRRCALILIEEWGNNLATLDGGGSSSSFNYSRAVREENTFLSVVQAESDILQRLQRAKTQVNSSNLRQPSLKRQRVSTVNNNNNNNNNLNPILSTSMILETPSYMIGNLRLFYLHIQSISIPLLPSVVMGKKKTSSGFVSVARLLQWHLTEFEMYGNNNNNNNNNNNREIGAVVVEDSSTEVKKRWRPPSEMIPQLRGEILCAAQL